MTGHVPAAVSNCVAESNAGVKMRLPFEDREDFEDAQRGFVGTLTDTVIAGTEGRVVWDAAAYEFLDGECPDSVNPSLWRQSQLAAIHGLFEVTRGIYQVRGLDLSNMTIVEGDTGVLVIDPLISAETAAASLALYREHRGDRPVTAMLYTHSHIDHFGGARGILTEAEAQSGEIPIYAPEGFLEHAVSENVYAGGAMTRRATYMFGAKLPKNPHGQVGTGLGQTTSLGSVGLIPPTVSITHTGQEVTVDGITMVFQMTPGTEAPAEMNFYFPDHKALCMAENATHNLHNVITLRGALVRDARVWSTYLDESIELYASGADVMFAQHHWPRWGSERIVDFLSKQRDIYAYIHDQTLRLLNKGLVGSEIAEQLELPPSLEREWHLRGYYGSLSHNVKAVYQRYLGWFDGNPAHLWPHPPEEAAKRYVKLAGGSAALIANAEEAYAAGDFRWVVEVVNHLVFAEPENSAAKELQARALEQLGFGAENGSWRNFYLTGALELREGVAEAPARVAPLDFVRGLTNEQMFDAMAIQIDGPKGGDLEAAVRWIFTDSGDEYLLTLKNGVLTHRKKRVTSEVDATIEIERMAMNEIAAQVGSVENLFASGRLSIVGDSAKLATIFSLVDQPDPGFAIVTP
ncbi:MAG: MBL fold metallo-hydrolase [Thermoleophilaceae bacterium]|nr:MBL fold metallo-hydrolase [Thermoleophilaceae bacterium]